MDGDTPSDKSGCEKDWKTAVYEHKNNDVTPASLRRQALITAAANTLLGKHPQGPETFRVIQLLKHTDPAVREDAIRSLAKIGGADAASFIARCLDDLDANVRIAACLALGQMRAHGAKSNLYDVLTDRNAYVRCAGATALACMGDKYGLPAVVKLVCLKGRHQMEALRSFNQITAKTFPLTQSGLQEAIHWIDTHKKQLLNF
jgi:hypothetical protein